MEPGIQRTQQRWKLPPLILHPFSDYQGPNKLVESSRASLILQGLLPGGEWTPEQLDSTLLDGRYCEIKMLYYIGKDLMRWIEQCTEFVSRNCAVDSGGISEQSFAALLVEDPPPAVKLKLEKWGVTDYAVIFARALGLNLVFAAAPERESLSDDFIRHYYRYADSLFDCSQKSAPFTRIRASQFDFDMFASGEYSRMLEREWQE